jgi:hypothetical protein
MSRLRKAIWAKSIRDDFAFTRLERPTDEPTVGICNSGEEPAGNRPDGSACVFHDLRLLIGIDQRRRTDHKATGLECVLPDIGLGLFENNGPKIDPGYMAE